MYVPSLERRLPGKQERGQEPLIPFLAPSDGDQVHARRVALVEYDQWHPIKSHGCHRPTGLARYLSPKDTLRELRNDLDLNPLRDRADFKALLVNPSGKAAPAAEAPK